MSAPRTTSGVLVVVAGLLVPSAAHALPTTTALTTPTTTSTSATTTNVVPPPATTTETAPAPTTEEAPATTTAPPATPPAAETPATTTPKAPTKDKTPETPVADDSGGNGRAAARRAKRAAERREAREKVKAEKQAAKDKKQRERAAEEKAEKRKKKQAEKAEKAAREAAAQAGGTTGGDAGATGGNDGGIPGGEIPAPPTSAVPNFFIDQFQIPPFLLPIYQAAGIQYGIRWEILAAINEIETNYGRNLSISTAGALGWMQFMPPTWKTYGVDANGDGKADPFNPVDAIFAAANYLKAAGSDTDIRKAIFAYNHADWYVNSVLARARVISGLPADVVGSLTGLTQGVFPVEGDEATYPGDTTGDETSGTDEAATSETASSPDDAQKRSIEIQAPSGSDVVAVQDGTVTKIGESERLGKFIELRDVYGNRYTYGHLASIAKAYPAAAEDKTSDPKAEDAAPAKLPAPSEPATAGTQSASDASPSTTDAKAETKPAPTDGPVATDVPAAADVEFGKERLFANPDRPGAQQADGPVAEPKADEAKVEDGVTMKPLVRGARVVSGTKLGTVAKLAGRKQQAAASDAEADAADETTPLDPNAAVTDALDPNAASAAVTNANVDPNSEPGAMTFEIRPAGKGTPRIDPTPILEGWKLLQTTSTYRAKGNSALFGGAGSLNASAGQVLLMSKEQLQRRVLADDQIEIYPRGIEQIRAGMIDRRILATLAFLSASGHKLSVSSLARPGAITTSGNVSEHDSGNAVDIASVDGQVISPSTQGKGTITEETIRLLLQLQGTSKPHQIISLMTPSDFGGADNILSLPDHGDHIHVGFRSEDSNDPTLGRQLASVLKPGQWDDLMTRLSKIENPKVASKPSKYALRATPPKRAKKQQP